MNSPHFPFRMLVLSVFLCLLLPFLLMDGMFMDGIQYACVSKNLAAGKGTFWFPFLSETWMKNGSRFFMEHPPLVYFLESFFFRAMGESMYAERLFSFLTALSSAFMIGKIWKRTFIHEKKISLFAWLPVLLWIVIPVCHNTYRNNLMENTLSIFTLAAVYFALRGLQKTGSEFLWFALSGAAVFFATFSKGLPGLFPLFTVPLFGAVTRRISLMEMLRYTGTQLAVLLAVYALLLLNGDARESLSFYFFKRLLYRIENDPVVTHRLAIVQRLGMELLLPLALAVLAWIGCMAGWNFFRSSFRWTEHAIFFFLLGLAGSLPLTLTLVQRGFYLVPSLPFFAISMACVIVPGINGCFEKINTAGRLFRLSRVFTAAILAAVMVGCLSFAGKTSRDHEMLHDVRLVGEKVPRGTVISLEASLFDNWALQFYLLRYFDISSDASNAGRQFYLTEKNQNPEFLFPVKYRTVSLPLKKYFLYEREIN